MHALSKLAIVDPLSCFSPCFIPCQVLLLVDGYHGFEMDTFEFLNILQAHGFPKVMGVLTHLDMFTNAKTLRKTKKMLKQRFWTEIYQASVRMHTAQQPL